MARTVAARALTEQHRQGQLAIRAEVLRNFIRLWPLWQGDAASFRRLIAASVPLVRAHHQMSGSLSAAYYEAFRRAERVAGDGTPRLPDPLDENEVAGTLFVTGQAMTTKAILAGQSPQAAMQSALVRTSGTMTRFTLQGGRDTVILSSAEDKQALGWARVTSGDPCAFCAVVASRGPVFSEDTADFEAHDHCACVGEPTFPGSEWPGRAREFRQLYNQHAAGTENPINEMRRVLAGA